MHQINPIEDLRSDLLPALERKYGEVYCRVSESRLYFKFKSEECALCGQTAINAYIEKNQIPARTISPESRSVILIIGPTEDDF